METLGTSEDIRERDPLEMLEFVDDTESADPLLSRRNSGISYGTFQNGPLMEGLLTWLLAEYVVVALDCAGALTSTLERKEPLAETCLGVVGSEPSSFLTAPNGGRIGLVAEPLAAVLSTGSLWKL